LVIDGAEDIAPCWTIATTLHESLRRGTGTSRRPSRRHALSLGGRKPHGPWSGSPSKKSLMAFHAPFPKPKSKSKPDPGGDRPPPDGRPRARAKERVGRATPFSSSAMSSAPVARQQSPSPLHRYRQNSCWTVFRKGIIIEWQSASFPRVSLKGFTPPSAFIRVYRRLNDLVTSSQSLSPQPPQQLTQNPPPSPKSP